MPTVAVDKADLYERLGRAYTTSEFDELCFEFGIELDEDTTEQVQAAAAAGLPTERPVRQLLSATSPEPDSRKLAKQLKIEIPANRYDLLCIEGIARALRAFLKIERCPQYKLSSTDPASLLTVTVTPNTAKVRPYFAAAVLRNVKFTPRSYESFIDLQEKLHQNICRRRQFVAIGTHDLDTLEGPFRYDARPPETIKFAPLGKDQVSSADQLMTLYESDKHISKYLPIIRDSEVYPIIYDRQDRVLSMPPIINSQHSKITLHTRNVFIDTTATDETKLAIVINMVALMFSEYCSDPFSIEPVKIVYPDGRVHITPNIEPIPMQARTSYINSCTGLSMPSATVADYLTQMSLTATVAESDKDCLLVQVPPTRPDILHECDIMEDAAIAYGFNNLKPTFPKTHTVAQPLAVSKLSDLVRRECAQAGWVEVLPLILCSHDENYAWMNKEDKGEAIKIANPKTLEFQIVRTTLMPGLLKTIRENRSHPLPIKIFECSDISVKDPSVERQSRNVRHAAAVWCNRTAGFEIVHGLLDRIMQMLDVPFIAKAESKAEAGYYIRESQDPTFFPGRAATIFLRSNPKEREAATIRKGAGDGPIKALNNDMAIGTIGILHPDVLQKFDIGYPCSALEFTLEPFKKEGHAIWKEG